MTASRNTILLAEDDEGHATLIVRNLKRAGVVGELVHVKDGQDALDFLLGRGTQPGFAVHLMLLDINMPRLNGVEVLREIKHNEVTRALPVMMLTTTDDPREVLRCYELGCSAYLRKPVDYAEFVEALNRLAKFLEVMRTPKAT